MFVLYLSRLELVSAIFTVIFPFVEKGIAKEQHLYTKMCTRTRWVFDIRKNKQLNIVDNGPFQNNLSQHLYYENTHGTPAYPSPR